MASLKVRKPKGLPQVVTGWDRRADNRMVFCTVDPVGPVKTPDGLATRAIVRVRGAIEVPGQDVLAHVGNLKLGHKSTDVLLWGDGFYVRGVDPLGNEWQGPDKSCVLFKLEVDVPTEYMAGLEIKDQ